VSARVRVDTKDVFRKAAKANGLSVALLVANVLDDYATGLEKQLKAK
jgi:hypothetical protein